MVSHPAERQAVIDGCLAMNRLGINQGMSGNLSHRAGDGFLVTPTSMAYDAMTPADIVEMGFDGTYLGDRRPSSEWRIHRDILRARPDVSVVLHAHPTFATALAVHGRGIPAFHYMVALAGGESIRCASYATFGTQELSDHALAALDGRLACLLANHGMIVLGVGVGQALALAVEVETLARQYLYAQQFGEPVILPPEEIARVAEKMRRMKYGQPVDDGDAPEDTARPRH
ncbi:class II aldolase/adducin family protein [Azospirillum picis]|uniref:L-fuculose-phosphate aldolase n=1 Tax=Azospirillum picis TaxID=488438 RepID=A0ABU0MF20_9PROT|nr:class II aldolase/adducin family protein [Azospirillum picis]MBP2298197.1 L-fuculose-phosphate aldolase [Azospirillum picis]MDQ0532035.1 L-fuculose-phosphate aldolase [Azospirillum picis]